MTKALSLSQVLKAARELSSDDQDALLSELLDWRAEAEHSDSPVQLCEEELALVRRGLEDAKRGDTVDADAFLAELRRGG